MSDKYRLLLEKAARLYEKHEAGRPEPFNVFSVLRKETDEVHLHSPFLHALLDYRQLPDGLRKNLSDFLRSFDVHNLDPDGATVEREIDDIDILIRDPSSMQAVIIENKIGAGDQPGQLRRYAEQLKGQGYTPHLLYLTLDGHPSSEDSAGGLDYKCISYKDDLPPWLKRCQKRADDEPALRESVAQYLRLIEKLTGKDYSEAYMNDLKELCLKGDNLVLVHDLKEAMDEARVSLLQKLWQEIDCKLREGISDLPDKSKDWDISEERIRDYLTSKKNKELHDLCYTFGPDTSLGVQASSSICFGVRCPEKKNKDEHNKLKEALKGGRSTKNWPWYKYTSTALNLKSPTRENLELLANEEKRHKYVEELVSGVGKLWERIKKAELA